MDTSKSIEEMSVEELQAHLASKQKAEKAKEQKAKKEYEESRDAAINHVIGEAQDIAATLKYLMDLASSTMEQQKEKLDEYGKIRSNSKGGFKIETKDGRYRIIRQYRAINDYDERASKAEDLMKDFLLDTVKKKDKDLFEIIMSLLERNKAGKLEYSRIQALYKHEDKYDDPRWVEAIRLFKESFNQTGSKFAIYFYERDSSGVFQPINLNFCSL